MSDFISPPGRDYTTVSCQVAKLEDLGLVARHPSKADGRIREAKITTKVDK